MICATRSGIGGFNVAAASMLSFSLGHSDSRITRKHYAHLLNEDLAAKMRAVMDRARV